MIGLFAFQPVTTVGLNLAAFSSASLMILDPFILPSSGNTAYVFDTSSTLLSGDYLLEVNNKNVTAFYIDYQGATYANSFKAYSSSTI